MGNSSWQASSSRQIEKRIIFRTDLTLQSPVHFGNGDTDISTDMPLLTSGTEESPLLLGSSLCGALRAYLSSKTIGYRQQSKETNVVDLLFGSAKNRKGTGKQIDYGQSRVVVSDSIGNYITQEQRYGVRLKTGSRTTDDGALYSYKLWGKGTIFPIVIQLQILEGDDEKLLSSALSEALIGLSNGQIMLGAKMSRGFGQVRASDWQIEEYDLTKADGLVSWLSEKDKPKSRTIEKITDFACADKELIDCREELSVELMLSLDSSILIRSRIGLKPTDPDVVHIQRQSGVEHSSEAIIPGTSWAGALRARTEKILSLFCSSENAKIMLSSLFGSDNNETVKRSASRLLVSESVIENCHEDLVQQRVAIDPFTGGAKDTALFDENPVYTKPEVRVLLDFKIINPKEQDIGIALLLIKDLWTGDLPIGGGISIGRGRFKGKMAKLTLKDKAGFKEWLIEEEKEGGLKIIGNKEKLEAYVNSIKEPRAAGVVSS